MKKSILILLAVTLTATLKSQVVYDYLRGADNYFRSGDYFSAANYYEKYLGMKTKKSKSVSTPVAPYAPQKLSSRKGVKELSTKEQAMYNLAESYRMLHYYEKAEPAYKEALNFDKSKFPLTRYWYASTLRSMGKYDESEAAYKQFLDEYTANDSYRETAGREIDNLRFIQKQLKRKDLEMYKVTKAGGDVPDSGASYAPLWYNNAVYFTSTMADKDASKLQAHNNRVYTADYDKGNLNNVKKVELPETKDVQQGVVSITPDGNVMYLTRWTTREGKKSSLLCRSVKMKDNKTWSIAQPLSETINVPGSNSQQGFVTPDGRYLLFASDRPGGEGGFDLWASPINENGQEGEPFNMGRIINTKFDEQAPYYHEASKSLVFSSNGRVGMGSYDFFYSKGSMNNWKEPVNFGYPVNSAKDDIYFTSRGPANNILDEVLLSSDRNDVCCLELFSLHKDRLPRTITGTVVSCAEKAPMKGVTVQIADPSGKMASKSLTTDASGKYSFQLDDYAPLKAVASVDGYFADSINFTGPDDIEEIEFSNPSICLSPFPKENPFRMNNVLFDFDSYKLREESFTELDKLVAMMQTDTGAIIEIQAHTDYKGTDEYNMTLSENRAKSVVDYLYSKGLGKPRVGYKAFGRTEPVAPNENPDGTDNPEGRQLNRRIEVKVLNR